MMKTTSDSETILTELMVPSYANFGGKVHAINATKITELVLDQIAPY